jgi:6-phosphofructo-2-kinase/fructose-2,6-biphosphatase 2
MLISRLKRFDQSTASSRIPSRASTPPKSVVGIGNKGMYYPSVSYTALTVTQLQSPIIPRQGSFWPWSVLACHFCFSKSVSLIQVGLPARGKSYLSNKLMRYLKVRSVFTIFALSASSPTVVRIRCQGTLHVSPLVCPNSLHQVFNVGQLRRSRAKQKARMYGKTSSTRIFLHCLTFLGAVSVKTIHQPTSVMSTLKPLVCGNNLQKIA